MAKAKILLVEDDKLQAKVTKEYLERNGYEVVWTDNGKSAIKIAKTQPVEIILLDLILPDISGNEVARWLKINDNTKGIPIIILTVKDTLEDKVKGLEAGAEDYLPKPYNEIELNAKIYACLRTKALQDELREKNRQLEEILKKVEILAIIDPLTELYNRRYFELALEKEFKRTLRYKTPTSCMMIDVDHFKKINDEYGHHTGDEVLKEIAKQIKNSLREIDMAARWGGEEFIILLPQTTKGNALNAATRISESIAALKFTNVSSRLTVSIGIAGIPNPSINSVEKFIQVADLALYEAKEKGRNKIVVA